MSAQSQNRFILVTRKTRLQELVERFNTWSQAKFYLEHSNSDAQDYLDEHDLYQRRLLEAETVLKSLGRFHQIERGFLPNYQFDPKDIIVVIGQDGLVANTLKYLQGQPVIAINPDPKRWDGLLLPFEIGNLKDAVKNCISEKLQLKSISFAEAAMSDGQNLLAVNDLFIGPKSHTSARYKIQWGMDAEEHSSSGIVVSTGFGSSGWFQSILAGALAVTGQKQHELQKGFEWSSQSLMFAVREPFPSLRTGTAISFGEVSTTKPLILESYMPGNGVIFSDGIEEDFIPFNSGASVTIGLAKTQGCLVCPNSF